MSQKRDLFPLFHSSLLAHKALRDQLSADPQLTRFWLWLRKWVYPIGKCQKFPSFLLYIFPGSKSQGKTSADRQLIKEYPGREKISCLRHQVVNGERLFYCKLFYYTSLRFSKIVISLYKIPFQRGQMNLSVRFKSLAKVLRNLKTQRQTVTSNGITITPVKLHNLFICYHIN
jgi:hypothetical protein